jgi:hypothetical protein
MDVLDWLEGREFQWDMYVDLPENTVRYCFRTLDNAARPGNALSACIGLTDAVESSLRTNCAPLAIGGGSFGC